MIVPTADGTPWAAPDAARNGVALNPFHIAALTFQRARQLKNGARPRVESDGHRPTRLALLEVLSDRISWSLSEAPPPAGPTGQSATPPVPVADQPRRGETAKSRSAALLGLEV